LVKTAGTELIVNDWAANRSPAMSGMSRVKKRKKARTLHVNRAIQTRGCEPRSMAELLSLIYRHNGMKVKRR
jgi:hypothetical protein